MKTNHHAAALAIAALVAGCGDRAQDRAGSIDAGTVDPAATDVVDVVHVRLHAMSKCPFSVQAIEAVLPALRRLGDRVRFDLEVVGRDRGDAGIESAHGPSEVETDALLLCAAEVGSFGAYVDFLDCMMEDWRARPDGWEDCAEAAKVDSGALAECKGGARGREILAGSMERSEKAGVEEAPAIFVEGVEHRGSRRSTDLLAAICRAYTEGHAPERCRPAPSPPKVRLYAITHERCPDCDARTVVENLEEVFPVLEVETLDWGDSKAVEIREAAGIDRLPAFVFDASLERDPEGLRHMEDWLVERGGYRLLEVAARFDPTAEVCDDGVDDDGDGMTDCDDPTCSRDIACRLQEPGRLDLFVAGHCPYGAAALGAMRMVLGALDEKGDGEKAEKGRRPRRGPALEERDVDVDFRLHFIVEADGDGFRSMGGEEEIEEDLRQLCAQAHYAEDLRFMDYVWCRGRDLEGGDWKDCTGRRTGVSADVIEECASGDEGRDLLEAEAALVGDLRIESSPTWMVNNQHLFDAIAGVDVLVEYCSRNPEREGCRDVLPSDPRHVLGACRAP